MEVDEKVNVQATKKDGGNEVAGIFSILDGYHVLQT